jgi:HNH endonuclease
VSASYLTSELRRLVADRAGHLCEYCLIHAEDMFFGCEVDHVISEKHGGLTREDNLAYACLPCNRYKGSDIASIVSPTGELIRLFNPRRDRWADHFRLDEDGVTILPLSVLGEATIRLLRLNDGDRLLERQTLRSVNRYPPPAANSRIEGAG